MNKKIIIGISLLAILMLSACSLIVKKDKLDEGKDLLGSVDISLDEPATAENPITNVKNIELSKEGLSEFSIGFYNSKEEACMTKTSLEIMNRETNEAIIIPIRTEEKEVDAGEGSVINVKLSLPTEIETGTHGGIIKIDCNGELSSMTFIEVR